MHLVESTGGFEPFDGSHFLSPEIGLAVFVLKLVPGGCRTIRMSTGKPAEIQPGLG